MSGASDFAATATACFRDLQGRVCAAFEALEPQGRFVARSWRKPSGHRLQGGGESRLMRGTVFEKVGVNVSHVWGVLAPQARAQVTGAAESGGEFVACGISLVAHMMNPFVPAVHLNLRYLSTSRAWFGGGSDLTPTFPFEEDTQEFHRGAAARLRRLPRGRVPGIQRLVRPLLLPAAPPRAARRRRHFLRRSRERRARGRLRLRARGRRGIPRRLSAHRRAPQGAALRRGGARAAARTSVAATWSSTWCTTAAPASASVPTRTRRRT